MWPREPSLEGLSGFDRRKQRPVGLARIERIRKLRKDAKPTAAPFTRLMTLLSASVGPLETCEKCHPAIWCFQRSSVLLSLRTSVRQGSSCRSWSSRLVNSRRARVHRGQMNGTTSFACHAAHFAAWYASVQEPEELLATTVVQSLVGLGRQSPRPLERVVLAAPVPERLVLDTPPALVELLVGVLDDVEGVRHLSGVRGTIASNTAREVSERSSVAKRTWPRDVAPSASSHAAGRPRFAGGPRPRAGLVRRR